MMLAAGVQVVIGWILTSEILTPNMHRTEGHVTKAADLLKTADPDQFRWAMAIVPALFVVSLVLCFILPETAPKRQKDQPAPA